jgi:hypothetical protein
MSTSWRDKQRPDLVNFIATFLATNLYRLNFLSLSPVRTPIQRCHWLCRAVCVTVCTDGFDWVGLGSRISSSTMGAYRLLSSSTRTGFLKGKLRSSAGDTLVSSLCYVCCYALMTAFVVMVMVMSYLECFCCRVSTLKRQFKYLYVVVVVRSPEQNESFSQSYFKYGPTYCDAKSYLTSICSSWFGLFLFPLSSFKVWHGAWLPYIRACL